jgi:hypothetical protein
MGRRSPISETGIGGVDPGLMLAALRERGAHRFDPVRFRFIEALARRAAGREGVARRVLDGKLATVLAAYVERYEEARSEAGNNLQQQLPSHQGPLAELVRQIAQHSSKKEDGSSAHDAAAGVGPAGELKVLRYFRSTWSKLSVDRQLTQSMAQVPKNAGPLNSQLLVLRSLQAMREASPEYLNRFVSYVDALLCLDQLVSNSNTPVQANAAHGESDAKRKPARGRTG